MQYVIRFSTSLFDVTSEDENPINPIYDQSLLMWLKDKVATKINMDEPDAEDWGWYSYGVWEGRKYLFGSCVEQGSKNTCSWVFQLDKQRTLIEHLLGKEKMTKDDECLKYILSVFEAEPEFSNIEIE